MTIDELEKEFSKYCHPSWMELLTKGHFSGLNRETYQGLMDRMNTIREFKIQYALEINQIISEFEKRKQKIDLEDKRYNNQLGLLWLFSAIFIFLVSGYFFDNLIIRGFISLFLNPFLIIVNLPTGGESISEDEKKKHDGLLLKSSSQLDSIFEEHIKSIKKELKELERKESKDYIQNMNPYDFEQLVSGLFRYFGYTSKVTKGSGDKGIDINIEKDGIKGIVQCKRYKKRIGTPVIRDFIGTMNLSGIHSGYIVVTSDFSFEVVNLLKDNEHDIKLIDIETLIALYKAMNNGEKPDFNQIISNGMGEISKSAANAELNQFVAKQNYRGPYRRF